MGYRVDFDRENALLVLSAWGVVTDKTALDGYELLSSCCKHYGNCSYILDFTHATEMSISSDCISQIAQKPPNLSPLCFQVVVAPQEEVYRRTGISVRHRQDPPDLPGSSHDGRGA